ncbi:MAG: MFS transporter [Myxococcota bacterium]
MWLAAAFLDELFSGVPSVASPELERSLGVSHAWLTGALFFVPGLLAFVIEPFLFVWAEGPRRRWVQAAGLAVLGASGLVAAWAAVPWVFATAIALAFLASGPGVALSQASLVDSTPEADRARALARWSLASELGDLAAPALLFALGFLGGNWRWASAGSAAAFLGLAVLSTFRGPSLPIQAGGTDAPSPPPMAALREALARRGLMGWLAVAASCDLTDELLALLAALHLAAQGAPPSLVAGVLGAGVVGSLVGAALTERALGFLSARTILVASAAAAIGLLGAWVGAEPGLLSILLFFGLGAAVSPHYPIAMAEAYGAHPGRSGTVNAALHVFTPITITAPLLLGLLADLRSPAWALVVIGLQPCALVGLGLRPNGPQSRNADGSSP